MWDTVLDRELWAQVPDWIWALTFFSFGSVVGSFLNVCIHRMPLNQSVVSPPSHCPSCGYSIPWYLNIPLITWLYLEGRCRNCSARISVRYFLVELLTGLAFLACWYRAGGESVWLAVVLCVFVAGLIVATFIDFEHYIIPDEITIGGMAAGFGFSLLVPALHGVGRAPEALLKSLIGMAVGGGLVYAVLRLGKLFFGRQNLQLEPNTRVVFTETALVLPDKSIPYEDLFYRDSDVITLQAKAVELVDRCYKEVLVRLSPKRLLIGNETLDPELTPHMEALTEKMILPREAMGLGDVKFMAGIGAFLGWKAVLFSLMASSVIGAVVGVVLILLRKQEWSGRLPFGPYIALAAVIWLFGGDEIVRWWLGLLAAGGGV